jgi:hypothetical protein
MIRQQNCMHAEHVAYLLSLATSNVAAGGH